MKNESVKLNWLFMYSLIKDLVDVTNNCYLVKHTQLKLILCYQGMEYLHFIPIGSHGRLKPSNCVIDSRWVLKVTDFGLTKIRSFDKPSVERQFYILLFNCRFSKIIRLRAYVDSTRTTSDGKPTHSRNSQG